MPPLHHRDSPRDGREPARRLRHGLAAFIGAAISARLFRWLDERRSGVAAAASRPHGQPASAGHGRLRL